LTIKERRLPVAARMLYELEARDGVAGTKEGHVDALEVSPHALHL